MAGIEYHLKVYFDTCEKELLYSGVSWYRKGIEDYIIIQKNLIDISFTRTSKVDADYVFKPLSPVRYELYRAACFYLAVTGTLPIVKSIVLIGGKEKIFLDVDRLTKHWANCHIEILLKPEMAAKCFQKEGKHAYIVLSYFLKAQLDNFPADGFRAAWSSLNALYSTLTEDTREREKINSLKNLITDSDMTQTGDYVSKLDDYFWKNLEWYNYLQVLGGKTVDQALQNIGSKTRDRTIYMMLASQVRELNKRKREMDYSVFEKKIEKSWKNRRNSIEEKYVFLITEYCYMIRNRSFHAARPYPVFGLFDAKNISIQEQLTEVVLHCISDLFFVL